ncbi:Na+/H+ antiporter NhaA, partial [Candidatus Saccharibacteria bacterium]|nr:Na+/H+ antiporter NhaA [Candidatus Saccharibacteria bacterium]NIW78570.1 Na+/H+ antiporter NhaA [Calditrichia bacterium]
MMAARKFNTSFKKRPRLPLELIDWIASPLARFLAIEVASGGVLLFFTIAALIFSNSPWSHYYFAIWETPIGIQIGFLDFTRSLHQWINDASMTLFFFLVALELKRELILGELKNPRIAALSIFAALGGMIVPAALYLILQSGQPGQIGWGTVMATDTAFVIGCLALLGSRIPQSLRIFMLSLAIVDDIGAILIVAVGYGSQISWVALTLAVLGFFIVRCMALLGVRNIAIYFFVGGLIWLTIDTSGIHPTVAGVILGLMTPTERWVSDKRLHEILGQVIPHSFGGIRESGDTEERKALQMVEAAARESRSPVEQLEIMLHPWVAFAIMPLFAFANAGVQLSLNNFEGPITLAVFAGLVLGKPIGILSFSWVALRTGIAVRQSDL